MTTDDQGALLNSTLTEALRLLRAAYSVPSDYWREADHAIAQAIVDLTRSDAWVLHIGDTQIRLVGATGEGLRSLIKMGMTALIDEARFEVRPMTAEERESDLEIDDGGDPAPME